MSDRDVAVSPWRALIVALGFIAMLTTVGNTVAGCGSSASTTGSGGQSGGGAGGRGAAGSGGQAGGGAGGVAGSGVGGGHAGSGGIATGGGGAGVGGGGTSGGVAGAGGGVAGAGGGGAGGASAVIWSSDATEAVVEDDGGGLVGPPPTGSECGYGVGTYTFTVADGTLAWHYCNSSQVTAGTPFQYVDGSRVLTADERNMLVTALQAVALSTRTTCGADKSQRLLTITRPSGPQIYRDEFYACMHVGVYVQGIDTVFNVAGALAK